MSRGFKRDAPVTKMLRENGLLLDRRSFVGYDLEIKPHLLLKGEDIVNQRLRLAASRKKNCGLCGKPIADEWEMDHKKGGSFGRCDCLHNLQRAHIPCHREKHPQVQLNKNLKPFGGANE